MQRRVAQHRHGIEVVLERDEQGVRRDDHGDEGVPHGLVGGELFRQPWMRVDESSDARASEDRFGRAIERMAQRRGLERRGDIGSVARDAASYPGVVPRLRVAAAQIDVVVGDLEGNVDRILATYEQAEAAGCDVVVFPELTITGYPPEDLLLRPAFVVQAGEALEKVAARTGRCAAVIGYPQAGRDLHNAAAMCAHGRIHGVYRKQLLPNYAVFDDQRYFTPGTEIETLYVVAGVKVGVSICEDAWSPTGPILAQAAGGAEVIVNLNGSPYYAGRLAERETMLATRAADASVPIVYANLVGGQDELVFDGASLVFDEHGRLIARAKQFAEDLLVVDLDVRPTFRKRLLDPRGRARTAVLPEVVVSEAHPAEAAEPAGPAASARREPTLPAEHEVYEALVLGTRDYVRKNGFRDVLIALSGGIDSSLVAAIAVDALGAEHVVGVLMPSRYSSEGSVTDARRPVPRTSGSAPTRSRSSVRTTRSSRCSTPVFAGRRRRRRRGEPPGAHPRQRAHDDLEQVRLDGAHHRQQERDGDRLRNVVRRHGRRFRGASRTCRRRSCSRSAVICNDAIGTRSDPRTR